MAVGACHCCVKLPDHLDYLLLNAQVGEILTHRSQQALDRGMMWLKSEEGHNFWREFYREERVWTDYASDRIRFYLGPKAPPKPLPEEDIWL